jgi:hypothetical protein
MSIEDINYMKENSIKQSYTFIIDSSDRDRNMYPNPNNYVVNFATPFKNIIGMEIIDASIPRSMYTIDIDNNSIYYYIGNYDGDDFNGDKNGDEIIEDGIQINNSAHLELKTSISNTNLITIGSSNLISIDSSNLSSGGRYDVFGSNLNAIDTYGSNIKIYDGRYAIINNSINIYNIYDNTTNIGGSSIGITFYLCFKPILAENTTCNILNFSYNHTYTITNTYSSINIDIAYGINNTYILTFKIGTKIVPITITYDNDNNLNIFWSIMKTTWHIGIFDGTNNAIYTGIIENCDVMYNVFYTRKYIGKKYGSASSWVNNNILILKDFKIYNVAIMTDKMFDYFNNSYGFVNMVVWYNMNAPAIYKKTIEGNNQVFYYNIINNGSHPEINYMDVFKKISVSPGDYTFKSFVKKFNELSPDDLEITFAETSSPPELTSLIDIFSKAPLIVDMKKSTISENLGFDLYPSFNNETRYIYKPYNISASGLIKMFYSRKNNDVAINSKYIITSPGIVYFIGNKYIILRCPEIEEHLYRSLSYSKYTLGLAKFRVESVGINSEKLSITKLPVREFHPIGKLSRLSLRFETNKGGLYDFKGINHNIIFAIFYYEPIQKSIPKKSILNPEYKMNYIDYLYKQEEIEGDSDEENEDFSRDNIDEYKTKEQQYDERGVKLQQFNNYYQKNNENIEFEDEDEQDNDDEGDEDNEGDESDEGDEGDEDNEGNDDQDNNDEGNDDNSEEGNEYSNDGEDNRGY